MKRTVANVYEDTREKLDKLKEEYVFSSDDQLIKYLCSMFEGSEAASVLKKYLDSKKKNKEQ